jgi:hypothetical protein
VGRGGVKIENGYVVVLSRFDDDYEQVIFGPFRSREVADERAGVIGREAAKYEDPEGSIGGENILDVRVEKLWTSRTPAVEALSILYGSTVGDA